MKVARELYPNFTRSGECDYLPMLQSFGTIILKVDDEDYQGDSYVLYQDEKKIGCLVFGWGSCSGCDALQGCETYEQLNALIAELHSAIKWFDDASQALKYLRGHDWKGDFCGCSDTRVKFVDQGIVLLQALVEPEGV